MNQVSRLLADAKSRRRGTADNTLFNTLVWWIALWASAFNLFNHHHYPLFSPESGLLLAALVVIALLMAWVQRIAGPRIRFLFTGLFAAIMIDLNFSIALFEVYALWAALAGIAWFIEQAMMKVALAAFASVLLFQFSALTTGVGAHERAANEAQVPQPEEGRSQVRAPIIHLVLDSHISRAGMHASSDEMKRLAADQEEFYRDEGFQLYPNAYSRHVKTINSLPHLFSYGKAPLPTTSRNLQYFVPDELAYFTDLDAAGYRTEALLPNYVDLCVKQKLARCRNYEWSELASMQGTAMNTQERAAVMAYTMLHLAQLPSHLADKLHRIATVLIGMELRRPYDQQKLFPLVSIHQLDRFIADLDDLDYGQVRLAHLLIPHDPYMLDAECRTLPRSEWFDERGRGAVQTREHGYAIQVRCLTSRVAKLMEALDRTSAGRDAIVIIHGDHGSRIAPTVPWTNGPELSDQELLKAYSTLFAIRVPGYEPKSFDQPVSLDELMADFRHRDFTSAPNPAAEPARVYIMDAEWVPKTMRDLPLSEK